MPTHNCKTWLTKQTQYINLRSSCVHSSVCVSFLYQSMTSHYIRHDDNRFLMFAKLNTTHTRERGLLSNGNDATRALAVAKEKIRRLENNSNY